MNCKELHGRVVAYVDGELEQVKRRLLGRHLDGCRSCARRVSFEESFNRVLREGVQDHDVPSRLLHRVRQGIDRESRGGSLSIGRFLLHPLVGYATAATLLVALVLPAALGRSPGLAGWSSLFAAPSVSLMGKMVCVDCDRAGAELQQQLRCRHFDHRSGIRTPNGEYWTFVDRGRGAELNSRPELRGSAVRVEGRTYPEIRLLDVDAFDLL